MAQQKEQQKKLLSEIMEADQKMGLYDNHIVETNKMVTAVEWLEEQLKKQGFLYDLDILAAKQMEKKQIKGLLIWINEISEIDPMRLETDFDDIVEQYYNETYGK